MDDSKSAVTIFTDGACSRNPGPGGWAALLILRDTVRFISGYQPETTNNRMEMFAAIFALKALNRQSSANIYTDSKYLQEGIKFWIHKWRQNNWRNSSNKPVVNQDLWVRLQELVEIHHVHWMWVRGHSTDRFNNFVDLLARLAISRKSGLDMKFRMHEFEEIIDGRQIPWKN